MSDFRTKLEIPKSKNSIDHKSKILMIGSCFSDYIGKFLLDSKFNVDTNPFGVLYNPMSIINSIQALMQNEKYTEENLVFNNDRWFSYSHHSDFSNSNKAECLKNINCRLLQSSEFLKNADYLIITLGTARVFELKETGAIVSNCHKIPASNFTRHLLSVDEIVRVFNSFLKELKEFNKNLKIIFTVSPVRHWKDGANGNQISKSTLLLTVDKLVNEFENAEYFPSYEVILDELRDYRFYNEDMLHPNNIAVNYIWERFSDTYVDNKTLQIIKEITKISQAKNHRPFNPDSAQHKKFLEKNLQVLQELQKQYPHINFEEEIKYFSGTT